MSKSKSSINLKTQASTPSPEKSIENKSEVMKNNEKVAIVGMSGFFPESESIIHFWEQLKSQKDFIKTIPNDHDPHHTVLNKRGAFIENLKCFDADLFNIIGKEAKYMPPQQRLLLMSVWNLFEDACILPSSLQGKKVAVVIGKELNPYTEYLNEAPITAYTNLGLFDSFLPNRVSHYFKLNGPSYCIDTACSGGLLALHEGKKLLKNKEVDYVIVAGVNLIYGKEWTKSFYRGTETIGFMSVDQESCFPFQEKAEGLKSAEGIVTMLLKRGEDAVEEQDNIHGFVIGSASNHVGGIGNIAFPDAVQQSKAIISAYEEANVPPETITYIEAHAASTILADAEEVKAFKLAQNKLFENSKTKTSKKYKISTLKPNLGHMHSTSGLVALVRMLFSFKEGKKLGIKGFENQNNEINLEGTGFYFTSETEDWDRSLGYGKKEIPRRGAINNYSGGGSNVHAIIEEPNWEKKIPDTPDDESKNIYFLPLSCLDDSQFLPYTKQILSYLQNTPNCDEKQLEYLYLMTRKSLNIRIVFRYKSIDNLIGKLTKFIASDGKNTYYLKGVVSENLELNELLLKNKKVEDFFESLNGKEDKSFLFDLWVKGYEKPVQEYFKNKIISKTSLPVYPFKLKEFWLEKKEDSLSNLTADKVVVESTKSQKKIENSVSTISNMDIKQFSQVTEITGQELHLQHHIVQGQKVFPAAAYLELARAAFSSKESIKKESIILKDVMWLTPFIVEDYQTKKLETILTEIRKETYSYKIVSNDLIGKQEIHSQGSISFSKILPNNNSIDIEELSDRTIGKYLEHQVIYNALKSLGFDYGPSHQGLRFVKFHNEKIFGHIHINENIDINWSEFILPPSVFDAALQTMVLLDQMQGDTRVKLPFSVDQVTIHNQLSNNSYVVAGKEDNHQNSELERMYCNIYNANGMLSITITGFVRFPYEKTEESKTSQTVTTLIKDEKETGAELSQINEVLVAKLALLLDEDQEQINTTAKFTDLGVDSMAGVEWIRSINEHFRLSIPPIKTYDYPTIDLFADYVKEQLPEINLSTKIKKDTVAIKEIDRNEENKSIKTIQPTLLKIQDFLKNELAALLDEENTEIDTNTKFTDLGVDSMAGVEWVRSINEYFGLSIPPIKTYDYPTIDLFAKYISSEIGDVIETKEQIPKQKKALDAEKFTDDQKYSSKKISAQVVSQPKAANTYESHALDQTISDIVLRESDRDMIENCSIKPNQLGSPVFQQKYRSKWSYYVGAMYRGIASAELVVKATKANILAIFGYMRVPFDEVEQTLISIKNQVGNKSYGIGFSPSAFTGDSSAIDIRFINLFIKHEVPVLELSAHISVSKEIVLARCKGLSIHEGQINKPRLLIGKLSRLELAKAFMSPAPASILEDLVEEGLISKEEAQLAALIPLCDDIVFEGSSGGYTDQQPFLSSLPSFLSLRDTLQKQYQYQEPILIGYAGGLGTPSSIAAAYMLGADFVMTGSINQCTVESGMSDPAKDLLEKADIYDFGTTVHGYALKYGFKIQALTKGTDFVKNSNFLADTWNRYSSLEDIPKPKVKKIEKIFGYSLAEVWTIVMNYKRNHNPQQIAEASQNPKLKMQLIFVWYYAFTQKVTLQGNEKYVRHYQIHSGAAMGAFNQFVKTTKFEHWKNRNVDSIATLLMTYACPLFQEKITKIDFLKERHQVNSLGKDQAQLNQLVSNSEIAVIGVSGRFPQANTVNEFWENIKNGKDCVQQVDSSRWEENKVSDTASQRWLGAMDHVDKFDPLFFNIAPRTAEWMDPQQRLFLEESWRCFEDAGYTPSKLSDKKCGVFVGCTTGGYGQKIMQHSPTADSLQGGAPSILSARIAYFLNLVGPCMAIDTACSSSLVALTEACNSLVLGQSDLALTGGVYIEDGSEWHSMYTDSKMLSKEGRCFTFDQRANGFVPGEGVGCVLLKRLDDAKKDGDNILGVIKGWGVNQDGATNGITAPSMDSQQSLQQDIYKRFNINPQDIQLVEAHGTGTLLGDPIEVGALTATFKSFTDKTNFCALGSVKSNIGHLVSAAGISGFIKSLMAIKHKQLPPTINFENLNTEISLENSPFYINTQLQDWKTELEQPRTAIVSSFGFSGTNSHVVIEEYKEEVEWLSKKPENQTYVFVLSAKDQERLKEYANHMLNYIESNERIDLSSFCYSLQLGRQAMNYRLGFVCSSKNELIEQLKEIVYSSKENGTTYFQTIRKRKELDAVSSKEIQVFTKEYIKNKEFENLIKLWLEGYTIDWALLYQDKNAKQLSGIPTYPFARERYWIPKLQNSEIIVLSGRLHPLVHENCSNMQEQRFTSKFTGDETFFQDHQVNGEKILPGVAYLEMAITAGRLSWDHNINHFKDVLWMSPIMISKDIRDSEFHIGIFEEKEALAYEIYSISSDIESKELIHGRGRFYETTLFQPEAIDISFLYGRMTKEIDTKVYYEKLKELGLDYGKRFRGLQQILYNDYEVLGKISLSQEKEYVLQPGILDSALHASMILGITSDTSSVYVPYSVKEVCIYGDVSQAAWSHVKVNTMASGNSKAQNYDVDILDEYGQVLMRFKDFIMLPITKTDTEELNTNSFLLNENKESIKQVTYDF